MRGGSDGSSERWVGSIKLVFVGSVGRLTASRLHPARVVCRAASCRASRVRLQRTPHERLTEFELPVWFYQMDMRRVMQDAVFEAAFAITFTHCDATRRMVL